MKNGKLILILLLLLVHFAYGATNYYELLGVKTDATPEQIKAAYKIKIQKFHPDRMGPSTEPIAKILNAAVRTLTDDDKRSEYDRKIGVVSPRSQGPNKAPRQGENGAGYNSKKYSEVYKDAKPWSPPEMKTATFGNKPQVGPEGKFQFENFDSKKTPSTLKVDSAGRVLFPELKGEKSEAAKATVNTTPPPPSPSVPSSTSVQSTSPDSMKNSVLSTVPGEDRTRRVVGEIDDSYKHPSPKAPQVSKAYQAVKNVGDCQIREDEIEAILRGPLKPN